MPSQVAVRVSEVNNDGEDDDDESIGLTTQRTFGDKVKEFAESDAANTAILGVLFAGWYLTNIVFNLYNKQARGVCEGGWLDFGVHVIFLGGVAKRAIFHRAKKIKCRVPSTTPHVSLCILPPPPRYIHTSYRHNTTGAQGLPVPFDVHAVSVWRRGGFRPRHVGKGVNGVRMRELRRASTSCTGSILSTRLVFYFSLNYHHHHHHHCKEKQTKTGTYSTTELFTRSRLYVFIVCKSVKAVKE